MSSAQAVPWVDVPTPDGKYVDTEVRQFRAAKALIAREAAVEHAYLDAGAIETRIAPLIRVDETQRLGGDLAREETRWPADGENAFECGHVGERR